VSNNTVASCARSVSGKGVDEVAKPNDKKILKRKLKEPGEWKDNKGKTPNVQLQMFIACKALSAILWRMLDSFRDEAEANGKTDASIMSNDVRLAELRTCNDLTDKLDDMSSRELLEYTLNMVHEKSVVVYLSLQYNNEVVQTFTGDKLFMVDQSLPP
jgi:hypothetical protein